jgi:glucuronate isomerase
MRRKVGRCKSTTALCGRTTRECCTKSGQTLASIRSATGPWPRAWHGIFYNLNPRDNEVIATMLGNFQDGITAGKMQLGSGWWFNDQLDGMTRQIEALSQLGVLARFVGMLTDSRSFLSYTRHEYFRRLLCNILGNDMKRGFIPDDLEMVGDLVQNISCRNARDYFGFGSEQFQNQLSPTN